QRKIFVWFRELAERDRDFLRRAGSLDAHGTDQDRHPRRAPTQNIQDVADGGSAGRGDDSDSARKFRERSFPRGIKKPFGLKFPFQRFELRLERTLTERLNDLHVDLVLAARFENGDRSENLHPRAIGAWW